MNLADILGVLTLVATAPLCWYVSWLLWGEAQRHPRIRVLRERAFAQTALAVIATVFGLIFVNNDAEIPPFDVGATRVITRSVIFLSVTIASLYWLRLYRRG